MTNRITIRLKEIYVNIGVMRCRKVQSAEFFTEKIFCLVILFGVGSKTAKLH